MLIDKISGIYLISHLDSGKVYVGSSNHIYLRWLQHKSDLRNNKHCNSKLQRAWNKCGEKDFGFELMEAVPLRLLTEREQYWMDAYDSVECGYNIFPNARSSLGRKISKESKLKMANSKRGIKCVCFGQYGNKHPASKTHTLRSPDGELVTFCGVAAFCREHALDKRTIFRIIKNEKLFYKGWTNADKRENKQTKTYFFMSPNKEIIKIINLQKFSKNNNLSYDCMHKVAKGKNLLHKGWTKYNG